MKAKAVKIGEARNQEAQAPLKRKLKERNYYQKGETLTGNWRGFPVVISLWGNSRSGYELLLLSVGNTHRLFKQLDIADTLELSEDEFEATE